MKHRGLWAALAALVVGGLAIAYFVERRVETPDERLRFAGTTRDVHSGAVTPRSDARAPETIVRRGRTYVPVYSHAYRGGGAPALFAITLSVRNVEAERTLTVHAVDYYDTAGHRVRRYERTDRHLAPLETAEYFVDQFDESGGSGANFVVEWSLGPDSRPPHIEAVMLGSVGPTGYSFVTQGIEMTDPPAP